MSRSAAPAHAEMSSTMPGTAGELEGRRRACLGAEASAGGKALAEENARRRKKGAAGERWSAAGARDEAADKSREPQPEPEKAREPKQKSVEMDFGM